MNKIHRGHIAELYVLDQLQKRGCFPLRRNYRGIGFEIDLIMGKGACLYFVEVKYRAKLDPDILGNIESLCSYKKRQSLQKGASHFLTYSNQTDPTTAVTYRIDLALVTGPFNNLKLSYFPGID